MRQSHKRIITIFLIVTLIISIMAVSASAVTIDDTTRNRYRTLTINVNTYSYTDRYYKLNTSRIYYQSLECVDDYTYVIASGSSTPTSPAQSLTVADGVLVEYVICRTHVEYSISSDIHEEGYTYADLRFKRLPNNPYATTGTTSLYYVWSPDSTGSYIPAT